MVKIKTHCNNVTWRLCVRDWSVSSAWGRWVAFCIHKKVSDHLLMENEKQVRGQIFFPAIFASWAKFLFPWWILAKKFFFCIPISRNIFFICDLAAEQIYLTLDKWNFYICKILISKRILNFAVKVVTMAYLVLLLRPKGAPKYGKLLAAASKGTWFFSYWWLYILSYFQ